MLLSASDLVLNANGVRVRPRRVAEERLLRVDRGVYVGVDKLAADPASWSVRARVAEARLLALNARAFGSEGFAFTGESALVVLGLDPWWNNPDVSVRRRVRSGTKTGMWAMHVGSTTVSETRIKQTDAFVDSLDTSLFTRRGLPISPLPILVLDLVRSAHPLQAFHDVSVLLRFHSRFDRWELERSQARAAHIKQNLRNELCDLRAGRDKRIHGFGRALAVLDASDPGVESPAHQVAAAAVKRQQDLEDLGWHIVNITYQQARDVESLVNYLTQRLGALGVRTHSAHGLLWEPPSRELFARHRRS